MSQTVSHFPIPTAPIGVASTTAASARIEELGRMIAEYGRLTDEMQRDQARLQQTVQALQNELSEKNRLLERRKRLAALGEIAAGMAHEIRNPLGGIQLCASMLADDLREQPMSLGLVEKISTGVKRLEALVSQVLHFTREIQARPAAADLAGVVDRAVELAWDRMDGNAVRVRASGPRPMMVHCDSLLMEQAILNLLINAIDAINGKGEIRINWSTDGKDGWKLSLRDSGPGIDPALADRIFNPFFTTKDTGTGLGLAIVHRIVEAHDGTISVSNHPGGGAVFQIKC